LFYIGGARLDLQRKNKGPESLKTGKREYYFSVRKAKGRL